MTIWGPPVPSSSRSRAGCSLLRGALVLLCLAALAGLFRFPRAAIPLGLGMFLALGLWMGSYALEAALLSRAIQNDRE